jgi:YidC/Oxa1 family membrane protein insertase
MERGGNTKWILFAVAIFLFFTVGKKAIFGGGDERQPLDKIEDSRQPKERVSASMCSLESDRFHAELSTQGASLRKLELTEPRFVQNLVTNDWENRNMLRTPVRLPTGADQQVAYDDLDWKIVQQPDAKKCVFSFSDDTTRLTKTVALTDRPYELEVTVAVENLGSAPKKHRVAFEESAWHKKSELAGSMGRQSKDTSEVVAAAAKVGRQDPSDFGPKDFEKPEFTAEKWRREPGPARYAAVSSVYFTKVILPLEGPNQASAETQIRELWDEAKFAASNKEKDPQYGYLFRARIAYEEKELKQGETATYRALQYAGPKQRDLLVAVGGTHDASETVNLGRFSMIAKFLVSYLYWLFGKVGSWGLAIVLLTATVRIALFPLSLKQIQNSAAMRKLKPQMDDLNEKYKDDAAQRGLALQELWRKNGVGNPVLGCLPMMLQLPVFWALYASIQQLVELYNTHFLWFKDLSAPDPYFSIPIVLGASSLLQQKLMPQQGDPQQQKMMMWMLPGIFTVMMLFLPVGLGVYMLTNTWLGIIQQVVVERVYMRRQAAVAAADIQVREKKTSESTDSSAPALMRGKGKARVRG